MAKVYDPIHDRDIGEIVDPVALDYYRGEGYTIDGGDPEPSEKANPVEPAKHTAKKAPAHTEA